MILPRQSSVSSVGEPLEQYLVFKNQYSAELRLIPVLFLLPNWPLFLRVGCGCNLSSAPNGSNCSKKQETKTKISTKHRQNTNPQKQKQTNKNNTHHRAVT